MRAAARNYHLTRQRIPSRLFELARRTAHSEHISIFWMYVLFFAIIGAIAVGQRVDDCV
jgi:hypothetical protein